jgi:dihydroorotase-like cyclic amidohydrolase
MSGADLDLVVRARHAISAAREGLRAGQIECVVSDHSPCTAELKTGDFAEASAGGEPAGRLITRTET